MKINKSNVLDKLTHKIFYTHGLVNTFFAISLVVCVGNYIIKSNSHLLSITFGLTLETTNGTTQLIFTYCVQGIFFNFKCGFQIFTYIYM